MSTPELLALSSRLSIGAAQTFRTLAVVPLLDNTQGVDPHVLDRKPTGKVDYVKKRFGEILRPVTMRLSPTHDICSRRATKCRLGRPTV